MGFHCKAVVVEHLIRNGNTFVCPQYPVGDNFGFRCSGEIVVCGFFSHLVCTTRSARLVRTPGDEDLTARKPV
jgi:hypothetical protein